MSFDAEALRKQIPYYLTAAPEQKVLVDELRALSEGALRGYYIQRPFEPYAGTVLQGDGWRGFQIFSFHSGERQSVRGIVLSNSCDVAPENDRPWPPKITFAPIVKLSMIQERFERRGFDPERIKARLKAIREQSVSNIFYLPPSGKLGEEYVALLDDLHSMPICAHAKEEKLFTLSMAGFYLFLFKLSVHFCRLQENINRGSPSVSG